VSKKQAKKPPRIVCKCNDVTEEEIIKAIKAGFDDIESLKRATGVTTGYCQGKTCIYVVLGIMAKILNKNIDEIGLPRTRVPLQPVPLGVFAPPEVLMEKIEKGKVKFS